MLPQGRAARKVRTWRAAVERPAGCVGTRRSVSPEEAAAAGHDVAVPIVVVANRAGELRPVPEAVAAIGDDAVAAMPRAARRVKPPGRVVVELMSRRGKATLPESVPWRWKATLPESVSRRWVATLPESVSRRWVVMLPESVSRRWVAMLPEPVPRAGAGGRTVVEITSASRLPRMRPAVVRAGALSRRPRPWAALGPAAVVARSAALNREARGARRGGIYQAHGAEHHCCKGQGSRPSCHRNLLRRRTTAAYWVLEGSMPVLPELDMNRSAGHGLV